jgi:hypothetical protein
LLPVCAFVGCCFVCLIQFVAYDGVSACDVVYDIRDGVCNCFTSCISQNFLKRRVERCRVK